LQSASMDFFTVPTATFRVLFALVILSHDRRRVVHLNVTAHPTAAWTRQQIREAFPDQSAPAYLVRDRDGSGRDSLDFSRCEELIMTRGRQRVFVGGWRHCVRRDCSESAVCLACRPVLSRSLHLRLHWRGGLASFRRKSANSGLILNAEGWPSGRWRSF
jgi:hypothetical protein